jgi:RNA polymerase sigma-70 factor, ECF subfamily
MTAAGGLLDDARGGDAHAFAAVTEPHRRELEAYCYRMLGSVQDAEDVVQETLVRAWRAIGDFDDRGHLRAWLFAIATRRCLTALKRRGRRELPGDVDPATPPAEVLWLEPHPGASPEDAYLAGEALELAFVAALQHLSPLQRATLVLREVLGFSAAEVAEQLDTTVAAVNSSLQRARRAIDASGTTQQSTLATLGAGPVAEIVTRWRDAWESGDVDAIVAMLAEDAHYAMPPLPEWYAGPAAIRQFLITGPLASRWRLLPTTANGQLAFGTYLLDERAGAYVPGGLDVLTIREGRVAEIVAFLEADLTRFDLPAQITV